MLRILKNVVGNLLLKKSLSQSSSLETKLNRCLSVYQLFFYAVSTMAGAGIYILAGHVIKNKAGPSTNFSFLIGGVSSFFTGLCYCELATLMPQAGSCYTYTYVLIGELPAFIIAWTVSMDCIITLASVSKGFSGVINMISNDAIGTFLRTYMPIAVKSDVWDTSVDLIAALLIICLFIITVTGANISFNVNMVLQSAQLLCLFSVTIGFFIHGSPSNYVADGGYMPFGLVGVIQGAGIAIFAYSGFESIANCAEEMKNPQKSIPIALFSSLGFVVFMYFSVVSGLSYMVPRLQINEKSAFVGAFQNRGLEGFRWVAIVGTLIATGATKLSITILIARVIYAVAKDGLIFNFLGEVNKTTQVPIIALTTGCSLSLILALLVKIETLADVTSMGILISFIAVGVDLIILRYVYTNEETHEIKHEIALKTRIYMRPILKSRKSFMLIFLLFLGSLFLLEIVLIFAIKWNFIFAMTVSTILSCVLVFSIILLCLFSPNRFDNTFETPLMPAAPVLTIIINLGLLLSLPGQTWLRFFVWMMIGIIIYISYAMWRYRNFDAAEEHQELLEGSYKTSLSENETRKSSSS